MTTKSESPWLDPAIARYVAARTTPPDDVLRDLAERTVEATGQRALMQISPDQGALLALLTRLVGAKHAVEIGTFTGYSSISIARALAPGGSLLCCDVSEEWTAIAREHWERAGLTDRIELRIAPAIETLRALPSGTSFDLAFIDADKPSYLAYYEALMPMLRTNGLILVDNTLWSGRVADGTTDDVDTVALREFNDHVASDDRVESYILPLADGLTLIRIR
ncbi:MAG TPA: class I SAM-dependent methyltransferase [Ilumatobacteraceae bacterium]